jgi:hypothetical protein
MSLRSIENIGCKYLMGVTDLGRGSVSQSNNSGYSPSGGRKRHIHLPKDDYSISQNYRRGRYIMAEQHVV